MKRAAAPLIVVSHEYEVAVPQRAKADRRIGVLEVGLPKGELCPARIKKPKIGSSARIVRGDQEIEMGRHVRTANILTGC